MSHTYVTPGRYTVVIRGRNYWGLSRPVDANCIISRIFDDDLPLASCVQNLAGFCRNSLKLQGVNVPTGMQMFTNIVNASSIFEGCTNLIYLNNFETKFAITRTITAICRNCSNLRYSALKLPLINPYRQAANIPSVSYAYSGCVKLGLPWTNLAGVSVTTTIQSLFPYGGFAAKAVNMTECFKNCAELTGTIPAAYLWQDTNITFTGTGCFTGCTQIAGQAPVSWGGTNSQLDTLIANHYWNYVPTAALNTVGGVKPDGITVTIDADGTIHAQGSGSTSSGGSSGTGLSGLNNTTYDQVAVVSGNRNLCGGYAVKITDYVSSNTPGATYIVIASIATEDDDAPEIDWDLLAIGTTLHIFYADNTDDHHIIATIASTDTTAKKIFFASKLQNVETEYSEATGTYAANKSYAEGAIETGSGRWVYTDLVAGTDYTAGDSIGANDDIFEKVITTTDIEKKDLVCGGYAASTNVNKGSDKSSYCFGTGNASNGNLSFVFGNSNKNAGTCTAVSGFGNAVTAEFSFVQGISNQVAGPSSFVIGLSNLVDNRNNESFVFGSRNELLTDANGISQFNTVLGSMNKTHGLNGILIGFHNENYGNGNVCIGQRNSCHKTFSRAFGYHVVNKTDGCIAIGSSYTIENDN